MRHQTEGEFEATRRKRDEQQPSAPSPKQIHHDERFVPSSSTTRPHKQHFIGFVSNIYEITD